MPYSGLVGSAWPRKMGLNWFMPALVNSSVGSLWGTTADDGTLVWPRSTKNWTNASRTRLAGHCSPNRHAQPQEYSVGNRVRRWGQAARHHGWGRAGEGAGRSGAQMGRSTEGREGTQPGGPPGACLGLRPPLFHTWRAHAGSAQQGHAPGTHVRQQTPKTWRATGGAGSEPGWVGKVTNASDGGRVGGGGGGGGDGGGDGDGGGGVLLLVVVVVMMMVVVVSPLLVVVAALVGFALAAVRSRRRVAAACTPVEGVLGKWAGQANPATLLAGLCSAAPFLLLPRVCACV